MKFHEFSLSTGSPICPVKMFEFYLSKLSPDCDTLWQKPRRLLDLTGEESWYEAHPVGHTPLETFIGVLSKNLHLSNHYTNHCIRATGMTLLNEQGFEAHHICAVSSHKSEVTIHNYGVKCPDAKKRAMSDSLAKALVPSVPEKKPKASEPPLKQKSWRMLSWKTSTGRMMTCWWKCLKKLKRRLLNCQNNQQKPQQMKKTCLSPFCNQDQARMLSPSTTMLPLCAPPPRIPMMFFQTPMSWLTIISTSKWTGHWLENEQNCDLHWNQKDLFEANCDLTFCLEAFILHFFRYYLLNSIGFTQNLCIWTLETQRSC